MTKEFCRERDHPEGRLLKVFCISFSRETLNPTLNTLNTPFFGSLSLSLSLSLSQNGLRHHFICVEERARLLLWLRFASIKGASLSLSRARFLIRFFHRTLSFLAQTTIQTTTLSDLSLSLFKTLFPIRHTEKTKKTHSTLHTIITHRDVRHCSIRRLRRLENSAETPI